MSQTCNKNSATKRRREKRHHRRRPQYPPPTQCGSTPRVAQKIIAKTRGNESTQSFISFSTDQRLFFFFINENAHNSNINICPRFFSVFQQQQQQQQRERNTLKWRINPSGKAPHPQRRKKTRVDNDEIDFINPEGKAFRDALDCSDNKEKACARIEDWGPRAPLSLFSARILMPLTMPKNSFVFLVLFLFFCFLTCK